MSELVLTETDDGVATITLNRPEARNALSAALLDALVAALVAADRDDGVGAIVLTGSDPAFCAGLDLRELGTPGSPLDLAALARPWPALTTPMIGAVNGVAITGGLELALNCDFLVASERARFGDTHARVGILPGWGLSVLLPQAIGLRRAVEMSLTGNFIEAEEALRLGLVNHVVPHDELLGVARQLAADITGNDRATAGALLASYRRIAGAGGVDEGMALEAEAAREWRDRTFDAAQVEQRRSAIMARGRTQQ